MTKKKKTNPKYELAFKTAYEYMLERQKIKRIPTGTPIDELIGGGIEEDECIEFYGEYGSGKSQICFTLAVKVAAQGNDVVYIDTENTFKPERIAEIAEANGYDPKEVLSRIHLIKPLSVPPARREEEPVLLEVWAGCCKCSSRGLLAHLPSRLLTLWV